MKYLVINFATFFNDEFYDSANNVYVFAANGHKFAGNFRQFIHYAFFPYYVKLTVKTDIL